MVEVPCVPLSALLDALAVVHINWFVLDVEGGELAVLRGVDWSRHSFDVVVVEADGSDHDKDVAVARLMKQAGYRYRGHVRRNDWFMRGGFVPASDTSTPRVPIE